LRHPPLGCSRFTLDSPVRNFSRIACNDGSAVIRVARDGGGIAQMVSYQLAADLSEGRLDSALSDCAPHPLPVNAVIRSSKFGSTHFQCVHRGIYIGDGRGILLTTQGSAA